MKKQLVAAALSLGLLGPALTVPASANDGWGGKKKIKHVLLISVDGMHALDVANYVKSNKGSALAELAGHGITYSNARTPANSDSFPGLLALVTGGSPLSHGLFYDVSYNRGIFDPTNTTCQGQPGNMQVFDESIDVYDSNNVSENLIDPTKLPHYINAQGKCALFFPHNAMQSNTIFEVIKAEGGRTAWADKHPAYDIVNGPSGRGVDDLFTPELTNAPGFDNTVSVVCTANNDELKVQAILNEIKGLTHDGSKKVGVPEVFGMNFQAVSVGQKLSIDNKAGGCTADTDSTINGQPPINPVKTNKPGHFADLVAALPGASTDPGALAIASANNCSTGPCGFVQDDDIALIWLGDQTKTAAAAAFLNANGNALFIDEVMAGEEIKLKFRDPLSDTRTPDILVQPIYGTIYTGSTAKNAEHGGFSFGDTNVGLIVSNPEFGAQVVKSPVATSQVAATLLQALGIDPSGLDAVRKEGTEVLPFASERDGE